VNDRCITFERINFPVPQNLTSCYNIPLLLPLVKVENIDSRQVQVVLATYSTGVYTIKANEHE